MNYYKHHLFFCNNRRKNGEACCGQFDAEQMYRYTKNKCRNTGRLGQGKIGVSETRCLGRCEFGPVVVVYPDNIWYQYIDEADIDEIITQHLFAGKVVERLKINDPT